MRFPKISKKVSVLALALAVGACDEGLTELNENPNNPSDATPDVLLRASLQTAVGGNWGALNVMNVMNHAGLWVQHVAQIQYSDEDAYQPRADNFQNFWDAMYGGPLKDFQVIVEKTQASKDTRQEAVGLIMKSWAFGQLTDVYGDVPYKEAFKGEEGKFTPKFDPQKEIYDSLFMNLRRADQLLSAAGNTGYGTADLIYGQDGASTTAEWQRFANSLRLRLAYHLVKVDPARARAEFEAAVGRPIFTSNDHNAKLTYTGSSPNLNPAYTNWAVNGRDDHRVSATLVNMLETLHDPRLPVYADPIDDDGESYVGYANGQEDNSVGLSETSRIGMAFRAADAPLVLMNFAEVQFLRAEAARLGWNAGTTAAAAYTSGVRASLEQHGGDDITEADITAYLAQPTVNYNTVANKGRAIAIQKWLALYMQGIEAWTNWRITGYPQIAPGPAARPGGVPRRYEYPGLEQSVNKANVEEAIARQGGAGLQTGRVWWDRPGTVS
ncbi:MAG TPA: SusD/RagB family nutrient-binding outer membrane lipoprotein [Longimicrobiaceae bacterium]